jgi:hypothetical protein
VAAVEREDHLGLDPRRGRPARRGARPEDLRATPAGCRPGRSR